MTNDPPDDAKTPSADDAAAKRAADRKARKAIRRLERAIRSVEDEGESLSDWEAEFARSVKERLETYGSAFNDPEKGNRDEALSMLQAQKVREIARKGKKKQDAARLSRSSGQASDTGSDEPGPNEPREAGASNPSGPKTPRRGIRCGTPSLMFPYSGRHDAASDSPPRPIGPPRLTVIKGGKAD